MSIRETIQKTVMSWPGVTERPHRFGGIQFSLGERELGHLHGDSMADLPFTRAVRDELIAAGRARPHHVLPDSGWVTYRLSSAADVPGAIALFRLSYDRALAAQQERADRADRHDRSPA